MSRHALSLILALSTVSPALAEVDFNRDVRPLLTRKCTSCHGGVKRAGGVSFIQRESVFAKARSGHTPVVPGKLSESELFLRITHDDPDERMPPVEEHPEGLTAAEVEIFRRWIESGARWAPLWSHQPPRPGSPPRVSRPDWIRRDLDAFVLKKMEESGLEPSPEAPRAQWLRRVSLDLTGLPPTPEELRDFLADEESGAHGRVVDRLLESSAYGERWASLWLDLARYADSQGYEKDGHRDIWAYRDWVIRAFHEDLPFDQFTVKQLAGDLLEERTLDDRIATAFHRNTQTNTEGGTDDEEFRLAAVLDRVSTTWTVWQASTFGCTQCHAHPYDPYEHREFYRFLDFFNSTADADLDDDFPRLRVPLDRQAFPRAEELDREIGELRRRLNSEGVGLVETTDWRPLVPAKVEGPQTARYVVNGPEVEVKGTFPQGGTTRLTAPGGRTITALRVDILPGERDPAKLPENGSVLSRLTLQIEREGQKSEVAPVDVIAETLTGPFDPRDSLKKGGAGGGSYPKLFRPTYLVFVLAEPLEVHGDSTLHLALNCDIRSSTTKGAVLKRFALSTTDAGSWTELARSEERAKHLETWQSLVRERNAIPSTTVPVMRERPTPARRSTHVFVRGNFLEKGKRVTAGVPAVLPPLLDDSTPAHPDRLDLARWLVDDDNPLTSRVLANRLWAELFGTGIVETIEDFGASGTPPSHPRLLDHLALRLQGAHGWRLKPFLRELVLSATYRQDHRVTPRHLELDPRNRLLSRGPRNRLTAEMVRDQALAVSGLLSRKMYGPSVMPPQPDGVWTVVYSGKKWKISEGEDRHRRALYTYQRRTSPYPSFLTFDAPSREVCVARRIPTNTPLQALVTLNDPVYVECARALAGLLAAESEDLREQIRLGHLRVTQIDPDPKTVERLVRLHELARQDYAEHPRALEALGEDAERAALVLVASTLLNLDSALTR